MRREKSLRNSLRRADAVVWEQVREKKRERALRDHRHLGPELMQTQGGDVHAVDLDDPARGLDDAEQREEQRALPAAGASADPELLARGGDERDVFQHER
eukprot:30708-Pelagococcus_subviridis.AAC.5